MKINTPIKRARARTHEGGVAVKSNATQELLRAVMGCLLWEDQFYEDGVAIATRMAALVPKVQPDTVASIAVMAREQFHLRHVPLFLCRELARAGRLDASTLARVIQRPDELTEFLAIYWAGGKCPLSKQVKLGLAMAFSKFNEYSLAKYNGDGAVKLRDVLFLTHPKPKDKAVASLWKKLVDGKLATPDTWETELSAGADKALTFVRLAAEGKLGGLATLRNLRNMQQAGVPDDLMRAIIGNMPVARVLPFRFIAAARFAPQFEPELEAKMLESIKELPRLKGKTVVLVDVSGSMDEKLSAKSDMTRLDAACGLAMILREICEDVRIYTFSRYLSLVPPRYGFALRDAIVNSQAHNDTLLSAATKNVNKQTAYDRLITITDEQSQDGGSEPLKNSIAYMLNVGSYQNGVSYGPFGTRISGFSEAVVRYVAQIESGLELV